MEKIFICGGKYGYHTGKKVIYLPVEVKNLPEKLTIKDLTLFKRAEFHISLVCIQKIIERDSINIQDFDKKVLDDFCEFVKTKEIKFLGYKGEFRYVEREGKKTVVVMCEMANLKEFFDFLNQKYSLKIDNPPAHVTLYTADGEAGIYLIGKDDIINFTQIIPSPIGRSF